MSDETFPACRYGPNGQSQVFDRAEDVPEGWKDHPSKVKEPKAEKPANADESVAETIAKFDHDGNGKPGGSPKGKRSTAAKGAAKRRKK